MRQDVLKRAAQLLKCPQCSGQLSAGADVFDCRSCAWHVREKSGWFDLLRSPAGGAPLGQRIFASPVGARVYSWTRETLAAGLVNGKRFAEEASLIGEALRLERDGLLLEVPCGQANFTETFASRCPEGVVVAIDLSAAQLQLAASRLARRGIDNVVLVRASALELPVHSGVANAVANCGGLHLYPDVPQAVAEMRRALRDGGMVAGLTLRVPQSPALRGLAKLSQELNLLTVFDFEALGKAFQDAGFSDWRWEGDRFIGYFHAKVAAGPG